MNSKIKADYEDIELAQMNIELIYELLDTTEESMQSPDNKRKLLNIMTLVGKLSGVLEKTEIEYRSSNREKKRNIMRAEHQFRTNYNQNADGRIRGAFYTGQGDIKSKR